MLKPTTILDSSYPTIREARKDIIDDIINVISKRDIQLNIDNMELYLIIDEALTNAMEHGNLWKPDKEIKITVSINSRYLKVTIQDEGTGFLRGSEKNINSPHLLPRGRGIYIIKQFCKPEWNKKGNQIILNIELDKTN
ncbi:MAG TPA: ATP-binding protein [Spirochaetota bacterium]|nr:ATP-binding protein [Spirochaetota bacterium]